LAGVTFIDKSPMGGSEARALRARKRKKKKTSSGKYVKARGGLPTHREKRSSLLWIIGTAFGEQMMWNSAGREMCIKAVLSASSPSLADASPYMTIVKETGSVCCWASCTVHAGFLCVPSWGLSAVSWLEAEPGKRGRRRVPE